MRDVEPMERLGNLRKRGSTRAGKRTVRQEYSSSSLFLALVYSGLFNIFLLLLLLLLLRLRLLLLELSVIAKE